uniref:Uncharacterized protein n=1 Tax=Romanomermis culicivorax TaxID=13658 RepID=A0A915I7E3_ROMCU
MAFIPPYIFPDISVQSVESNVINLNENCDTEAELTNMETLHKEKVNFVVKQYADVIPAGKSHISDKDNEDEDDEDIEDDDEFESADVEDLEEIDAQALYAEEPDASAADTNRPPRPPV